MTRRIVFAGGVQAKALARAYRLDVAGDRDEDVFFIGTESMAREAAHRVIAAADIVITEVSDAGETVPDRLISASAHRIAVPVVYGAFLWPFAGKPHPRNRGIDALPDGPYPADFGDSYLDSMLAERVPEDEAVQRYLELDVAAEADLDGLLEHTLARQARLDARTGFDLASFIGAQFRNLNLFATRERLRLPLFQHVAATVFDRMGIRAARADLLFEAPFAAGAMPIHPAVLQHFGMQVPLPDHRYPVLDEGLFTFEQYCRRYLRYEWNERLHVAMALAETSPAGAVTALRLALDTSPGSRAGLDALDAAERALAERSTVAPLALAAPQAGPDAALFSPVSQAPASHEFASQAPDLQAAPLFDPLDAAPDAPSPADENPGLVSIALPEPLSPPEHAESGPPVFAEPSFARLRFPPAALKPLAPSADDAADAPEPDETLASPLSVFGRAVNSAATSSILVSEPAEPQEQQTYVELPKIYSSFDEPAPLPDTPDAPARYIQLPPSAELIEVLPRMLSGTRAPAGAVEASFATMPESMPPPPLRPVLPPELQPEHERRGLMAKLFGGSR